MSIGIGCRRHTAAGQILAAVRHALGSYPFEAIRCIATIESKAQEPGLLEFCARYALPLLSFSRAEVAAVRDLPTPSAAARAHLGVEGVCEPCALLAAPAGHLIVPKTVLDGVTVAIATSRVLKNGAVDAAQDANVVIAQGLPQIARLRGGNAPPGDG